MIPFCCNYSYNFEAIALLEGATGLPTDCFRNNIRVEDMTKRTT